MNNTQEDLERTLATFKEIRISRVFYREQQFDAIINRQRDNIIQFSAIAVAAGAIAGSLMLDNSDSLLIRLSIFILFSSSIFGSMLSLDIMTEDARDINNANTNEQNFLNNLIEETTRILNKSKTQEPNPFDLITYLKMKDEIYKSFLKKRTSKSFNGIFYQLFLVLFYVGLILLVLSPFFNTTS